MTTMKKNKSARARPPARSQAVELYAPGKTPAKAGRAPASRKRKAARGAASS
jgi:hypothetical protein